MAGLLSDYELCETLYESERTTVYRARHTESGQSVILKLLSKPRPSPHDALSFRREAEIADALHGEHFVDIVDVRQADEGFMIVQEDIGAESLDKTLQKRRFGLETFLKIALEIAEALDELHRQGIIHKDLNPSNIIWNPATLQVKLIDFGLSTRRRREAPDSGPPQHTVGTLPYISPEQTGRIDHVIDHRTDFYSLGVSLYELWSGRLPFEADDPAAMIHNHLARSPPPLEEARSDTPHQLARLIAKLMAKSAEKRYQQAAGLYADLATCLEQWRSEEKIDEFDLGRRDISDKLDLPRQLFGRDDELALLKSDFRKCERGGRRLRLLHGDSGVGKSALLHRFQSHLPTSSRGLAVGVFDSDESSPYEVIGQLLDDVVTELLAGDDLRLSRLRHQMKSVLGDDAALVAELVPSVRRLMEGDVVPPSMNAQEARHRFRHAISGFVALLCDHFHPLVLVLDDLQWIDRASLELLQWLMCDEEISHLLIIGAYRTKEVDGDHPLQNLIGLLRDRAQQVEITELAPLDRFTLRQWVAAALHEEPEGLETMADLVYDKTGGNPYFAGQFLADLHRRSLLWFDDDEHRWRWDTIEIATAPVTENIVDLLTRRIDTLDDDTRTLLQYASLLGRRFSLHDLEVVCETSATQALALLEPAIDGHLVVPVSESSSTAFPDVEMATLSTELVFAHDRVREALKRYFSDDELPVAHLRIARLLRSRLGDDEPARGTLFAAANHFRHALQSIDDDAERVEVARLLLEAGRRSLQAQAPAKASLHFQACSRLLGDEHWESQPEILRSLYVHWGRAESLLGHYDQAEALARQGLRQVDDPVDTTPFYITVIRQLTRRTEFEDALATARRALRPFDITIASQQLDVALMRELGRIEERLAELAVDSIADIPVVEDDRADAALALLSSLQPVAGMLDRRLLLLVGLHGTSITLDVGIRPQSVTGLAMYAATLCGIGEYKRGYEIGQLAIDRARAFGNQSHFAHTAFTFGALILPWCRHLDGSLPILEQGLQAAQRSGNHLFSGYNAIFLAMHHFALGHPLEEMEREITRSLDLGRQLRHHAVEDAAHAYRLVLRNLRGKTTSVDDFSSDDFPSGDALIEHCNARGNHVTAAIFRFLRAQVSYLLGDSRAALEDLEIVEAELDLLLGTYDNAQHPFWQALASADVALHTDDEEERSRLRASLDALYEQLSRLAEQCPENFLHKERLVAAEMARLDSEFESAMHLYDEAIAEARQQAFFQLEAVANERAALFWQSHAKPEFALPYLSHARDGYKLWRADRKVTLLEEVHDLRGSRADSDSAITSNKTTGSGAIDVISVFKSSELIASRLDRDELLSTLLQVTLENAGAQHAAFIICEEGELFVSVEGRIDEEPTHHQDRPLPLEKWTGGARSIVRYVHRTAEPVVLRRRSRQSPFRSDPYLKHHRPRSLLCLPVAEDSELRGVLYLENDLVDEAFTEERTRVLEILAGHIAVALSKARLYARLQEEKERFRQLAENIQEVFWLMDCSSKSIIYVSPAYESIWGRPVPPEPLSITDWLTPVISKQRRRVGEALKDAALTGDYDQSFQVERPDGSRRWIRDRGFPIRDRSGRIFRVAGVAMDITSEREVARMKDELLSIVSHELRTPLTPIIGVFSMLDEKLGDQVSDDTAEMVHLGLRNSRRLLRLVEDLLDVQRLSRGEMGFDFEIFDACELVEEAVQFQQPVAQARDVELRFFDWSQPLMVHADRDRLLQVIRNLLSNAIKFSHRGKPVDVELRRLDGRLQLAIADRGPGIPGELHDKVFEKFTQADSSLTRRHGGTGLGLAIAHSIVQKLDGEIYFESRLGEGTTFYVELELAQED